MIKFLLLDFLGVLYRIPWQNKNGIYFSEISSLIPEIFKFEKSLKYANEVTDDVIHWAEIWYQVGRLIVQETHLQL